MSATMFPVLIQFEDGTQMFCNSGESLPPGKAFTIVGTHVTAGRAYELGWKDGYELGKREQTILEPAKSRPGWKSEDFRVDTEHWSICVPDRYKDGLNYAVAVRRGSDRNNSYSLYTRNPYTASGEYGSQCLYLDNISLERLEQSIAYFMESAWGVAVKDIPRYEELDFTTLWER